jgi:hypothetical protein
MEARIRFASLLAAFAMAVVASRASAGASTIIDNASSPADALITMPAYTIRPLGKWTVVVTNQRSISFSSIDGKQTLVPEVAELHPKRNETEAMLFDRFVEQKNAAGEKPCALANKPASANDVRVASWCSYDATKSHGTLSAVLMKKRKILNISFEADAVAESDFRQCVAAIVSSMTLK